MNMEGTNVQVNIYIQCVRVRKMSILYNIKAVRMYTKHQKNKKKNSMFITYTYAC